MIPGFLCLPRPSFLSRNRFHSKNQQRPPSTLQVPTKIAACHATHASSAVTEARPNHSNLKKRSYDHVLDSVLKVYCSHCEPNYELPWSMTAQRHSTSSAFIIPGRRILTNAHSVEHHTSVRVKKRYSDIKYDAEVIAIGNECDIALLKVHDEYFWEEFEENHGTDQLLYPGPLPELQDPVRVIGYPSPGNQISVTAGVCSRIEMQHYVYGQDELLAVQIDAAINPGNSGGPVIDEQLKVIGIAFQSIDPSEADSIGYFIPHCVVDHFLDDIACNGQYTGFPFCGFHWQIMENPYIRQACGMDKNKSGILVQWVAETVDAARVLKKGDVITHIDNVSLSNSGTVPFRNGERISFEYMITSKFSNDSISLTFQRDGQRHEESYQVSTMRQHCLVPIHDARYLKRRQPEYLICGGLVFQSLSEPFCRAVFGRNWLYDTPVALLQLYFNGTKTKTGRNEVVLLTQVLSANCTMGYESDTEPDVRVLELLNSEPIQNLRHLSKLLDSSSKKEKYFRFEFVRDHVIILDKKEALREQKSILETYCIPTDRSLGSEA